MKFRSVLAAGSALLLLFASGCATRYQDLLRDRDMEINELEGQLSDMRAKNAELERLKSAAEARAASLASNTDAQPVDASTGELARLDDISGVDVRYDGGKVSIGIDNTVTFDSGSITLKPSASSVLQQVASVLRSQFGANRIYVEGHTDADPIKKTRGVYRSNRHLSVERADAVARYLIDRGGVAPRQVAVVGYGPYDPLDPGSGDSAKARNRRVEIVVGETI